MLNRGAFAGRRTLFREAEAAWKARLALTLWICVAWGDRRSRGMGAKLIPEPLQWLTLNLADEIA